MGRSWCKVSASWFQRKDSKGRKYSLWLKKETKHTVYCKICCRILNISYNGFKTIQVHEETQKHKRNEKTKLENQTHHSVANPTEIQGKGTITKSVFTLEEEVIKAELLWVLKVVLSDFSAASSDDIKNIFKAMFPGEISSKFSMERIKLGYFLTEAIGPYSYKYLLQDIGNAYYTLAYDETTNTESAKELQIRIRYWSDKHQRIITSHLETFFLGSANAEIIYEHLNLAINNAGLPKVRLLMLEADGPNVNKKVFQIINEEMKIIRKKPLLEIGSCSIHISHNAFLKGLQEYGIDVQDFVLDLYYFFHGWPQRKQDFRVIQEQLGLPKHKFIKYVTSRWLTLSDAAQRILEQWLAIKKYFINFIPSKRSDLIKTQRYQSICQSLGDKTFKYRILFIISSANSFKSLNTFLQTDAPLIHELYQSLDELVKKILFKFVNEKIDINYEKSEEMFKSENLLPLSKIYIGEETKKYLDETKCLSEKDKFLIYTGAQKHYIASTKHLINKFVLKSTFLKYCKYLNPKNIVKSQTKHVTYLSEKLTLNINGDQLADEWRLLKTEEILLGADTSKQLIENFWNSIFAISCNVTKMPKYPNIKKLVSACLCLSHGNANVEREFSRSGRVLTEINTQMSLKTLNARLNGIELLKRFGNKPYCVPMTHELLKLCKNAHKSYLTYLEKEKLKAEEIKKLNQQEEKERKMEKENEKRLEQTKRTIEELELEIQNQKKKLKIKSEAADTVFSQASKQLKECLSKNDLEGAKVAEELLDTYKQLRDIEKEKFDKLVTSESKIEKRKATLLTQLLSNKRKK